MGSQVIYPKLSYRVMQAVFEVHNTLGPGFAECLYEEALAIELERSQISFERQACVEVSYKGTLIGTHRLDLLVDQKIILELKAVSKLTDVFKRQTLSYLKAANLKLGILINFGTPRVNYYRIVN